MCVWKKLLMVLSVLALSMVVQAEEAKKEKRHLVDMADGLNQQQFYETRNPDAVWSTDGQAPWTKSDAVNAWEQAGSQHDKAGESASGQAARAAANPVLENGKPVEAGRLINVRVRYTLDPEHSKASFSPVSAQSELYRQMGSHCANGFQKVSEWSEPVEQADYYLYYQFRCIAPETD